MPTAARLEHVHPLVVTPPAPRTALQVAAACREAGLAFLDASAHGGVPEVDAWLSGRHAPLLGADVDVTCASRARALPFALDARAATRAVRAARIEVAETLARAADPDAAAAFVVASLAAGFVVRDGVGAGWRPTSRARRLTDRVLSLFAVDYLVRPDDYESDLVVCPYCLSVAFGESACDGSACDPRHSTVVSGGYGEATLPSTAECA